LCVVPVTRFLEGFTKGWNGTLETYTLDDGQKVVIAIGSDRTCAIGRVNQEHHTPVKYYSLSANLREKMFQQTITFSPFVFSLRESVRYTARGTNILKIKELGVPLRTITFPETPLEEIHRDIKDALALIDTVGPFINISNCHLYPNHPIAPWEDTSNIEPEFQNILKSLIVGYLKHHDLPLKEVTVHGRILNDDGTFDALRVHVKKTYTKDQESAPLKTYIENWLNAVAELPQFPIPLFKQSSFSTHIKNTSNTTRKEKNIVIFGSQTTFKSAHDNIQALKTYAHWTSVLASHS
jgi:hypothetical protein